MLTRYPWSWTLIIFKPQKWLSSKVEKKWQKKKKKIIWLSYKNHVHSYRSWQNSLQSFKLISIKLYEELRTQGTHHLSSNAYVEKGKNSGRRIPIEKWKKYGSAYFSFMPRGYKTFFMLNSAEHEIFPANKSQITNNCKFFLAKHSWAWKFLC